MFGAVSALERGPGRKRTSIEHTEEWVLDRSAVHFLNFVLESCRFGLRRLRLEQDRAFLDGARFLQSNKDNMYLLQEHSALENIKYILFLD